MGNNQTLDAELDELLSEDVAQVIEREKTAFNRLVEPFGKSLVLFGAGNLGREALARLRQDGVEPLAFTDNNPSLWGKSVNGVRVVSPDKAAEQYGQRAAFVVTIRSHENQHRFVDTKGKLKRLNCQRVVSFMPLLWKYGDTFLPYFYIDFPHKISENAEALRAVFALWADEESRRTYLTQLRWRLLSDYDGLPGRTIQTTYFPEGVFSLRTNEVFVDCGAYDGDTTKIFLEKSGSHFDRVVAFEPDPINFQNLKRYAQGLPAGIREKIILLKKAVGKDAGKMRFNISGTPSSHISMDGSVEVECVPLDSVLSDFVSTYIKMDIEGAELDALIGARTIIERECPVLAVCVYHQQDHLWRIPSLIRSLSSRYRFFLRAHNEEGWELVCYAVPISRLRVESFERSKP